ncbi:hypothetical protein [Microbacterium aurugineum]|uniref:hypothetical protein n=1 Tax=Microbacterium aurugineum TaxID=2851642 RepID=UPI0020C0BA44|nr:hypothetical protein [Microbacterium aurugineum]MCK8475675.1 hypothetical protein [Microbacterium aurugineum]
MRRVWTGAVIAAAITLGSTGMLTGCTSEGSVPAAVTATPTDAPTGFPVIPEGRGIITSTVMTKVTSEPGTTVVAEGTVTMPEGESGAIAISVSWVDPATSAVYARGVTVVDGLAAGEQSEWTTSAELPESATDVATVLGAVIVDE